MIRKLRLKFIAVCMLLVSAVLLGVIFFISCSVRNNIEVLSQRVLERAIEDRPMREDLGIDIAGDRVLLPYFTVELWTNGENSYNAYVTGGTYADIDSSEQLADILTECLSREEDEGILEDYHLRYLRQQNGLYDKFAFVDMSMQQAAMNSLLSSYLLIALCALVLLLAVSIGLSWWVTLPVDRAWKQQQQFVSDASHELKTPLTVILSNAELLESASLEEKPARWVDNITQESQRMRTLVEELLTLARADNHTSSAVLETIDFSDLVSDCVLSFEPVAFEAGRLLEDDLQEGISVCGDREKIRRLCTILLDNAVKYGTEGGTITVSLRRSDRQVLLSVSNPGTPIPPEQLPHLFERFYRADASRGEQAGFGLGLSIAKVIADEHHGTLRAESNPEQTTFTFQLPLKS